MSSSFDRIRPRAASPSAVPRRLGDHEGKRSLFSGVEEATASAPAALSVELSCRRCGERSVVPLTRAVRLALPSVSLGLAIRHGEEQWQLGWPWTWMRCPACRHRSWVQARVTV